MTRQTRDPFRHMDASGVNLVHEGGGYAVIEKPAGMRSVPGRGAETDAARRDSVATWTAARFPDATGSLIVHRLDIETSGLMVVALDRDAHRRLSIQFMKRKVGKTYAAILDGLVEPDEGAVDLPLAVDWPNRPRHHVEHERGRPSRTLFRVQERDPQAGTTRVAFRPVTGRTHQVRVHAAHPRPDGIGCPVLGDTLYGDPSRAPRLMLHADFLAFWDPDDSTWKKFASAAPF